MSIFMRLLGPAVLPLWDLQGSGRWAGQECFPSSRCTNLLPSGAFPCGITGKRPGAFFWLRVEEESDRPCGHTQIRPETATGEHSVLTSFMIHNSERTRTSVTLPPSYILRSAERTQSFWLPTPTLATSVISQGDKCWVRLPRNLSVWAAKRGFPSSTSPAWAAPTVSSSCTGAGWTASSWRRRRRPRCWRRPCRPLSLTYRWETSGWIFLCKRWPKMTPRIAPQFSVNSAERGTEANACRANMLPTR